MDRARGLSVRLKLTLSYAGFLMLAGALLLAVVWVFLLRYVPDVPGPPERPPGRPVFINGPSRSDLVDAFFPKAAIACIARGRKARSRSLRLGPITGCTSGM